MWNLTMVFLMLNLHINLTGQGNKDSICLTLTYFPKLLFSHFPSIDIKEESINFDEIFPIPGFRNCLDCNPSYPLCLAAVCGRGRVQHPILSQSTRSVVPGPVCSWKLILYVILLLLMPASVRCSVLATWSLI